MKLYFAYGSNLNVEQMAYRCPKAVPAGSVELSDHELTFRGVADVVAKPGARVVGGLWKITRDCERRLDIYEGVSGGLYRKEFVKVEIDGEEGDALVYKMNSTRIGAPTQGYLQTIVDGYHDFGLDFEMLKEAVIRSINANRPVRRRGGIRFA